MAVRERLTAGCGLADGRVQERRFACSVGPLWPANPAASKRLTEPVVSDRISRVVVEGESSGFASVLPVWRCGLGAFPLTGEGFVTSGQTIAGFGDQEGPGQRRETTSVGMGGPTPR
jgi:hypothetical protein